MKLNTMKLKLINGTKFNMMTLFLFPTILLLHAMQPDKKFNNNGSQENTNRDTVLRVTAEEKEIPDESDVSTFYRASLGLRV